MTNEEAIPRLYDMEMLSQATIIANGWSEPSWDCFALAYEALKKQIPKKPVIQDDRAGHKIYSCECGYLMRCEHKSGGTFHGLKRKYCPDCGQAIDWSEE